MKLLALIFAAALISGCQGALQQAVQSPQRTPSYVERDQYRHPQETLKFFGIRPDMTVVEIWPGPAGWYSEILAPYLYDKGTFYAAHFPSDSDIGFYTRARKQYEEKLAATPSVYGHVKLTSLYPPAHIDIAPAGSADAVLTFRNVHNWAKAGNAQAVFNAFYKALKPGGILGVVEHRADPGTPFEQQISSGYMSEDYVIALATRAGFSLEARSNINANPNDDHHHPAGVWTLPPTLRLGDQDKQKYLAIGESDRMTLRFRKLPASVDSQAD